MDNLWWAWIILAGVFIVGEILTVGFFLLWFGIGAAAAGLVALLGLGLAWQLLTFAVVTGVLLVYSQKFAERVSHKQPTGIGADRLVAQRCMVVEDIDNLKNTGRVRLEQDEWRAASADDKIIAAGTVVEVVRVKGTQLIVEPFQKGEYYGTDNSHNGV